MFESLKPILAAEEHYVLIFGLNRWIKTTEACWSHNSGIVHFIAPRSNLYATSFPVLQQSVIVSDHSACVSPHCAHIFWVTQVTTGMHCIRAFKAEKQQNSNIKMRGVGSLALGARTDKLLYQLKKKYIWGGTAENQSGWKARKPTKGFLSVSRNRLSFSVCVLKRGGEKDGEGHRQRKLRGGAGVEEKSELL